MKLPQTLFKIVLAGLLLASPALAQTSLVNGKGGGITDPSAFRIALGGTTVGRNLFVMTNPSAVRFLRVNADNTVDALSAANMITALGASSTSGTETLTNKTIALGSNTVSGTTALFNTALTDGDFATIAGTETLTGKTLTAPRLADLGFLADANGNELLIGDTVTSAVNEITLANAATTGHPSIFATGGDTNVNLILGAKGTGVVTTASRLTITNNTGSSSSVTGALVVTGGAGFGGDVYASSFNGGTFSAVTLAASSNVAISNGAGAGSRLYASGALLLARNYTNSGDCAVQMTTPILTGSAPATASSTGVAGSIAYDSGFMYVCVATNTWKRVAISTW